MWGVIKRDLAEFVTVVKADTTEVVKKTITDKQRDQEEAEAAAERRALQKEKAPLRALVSDLKTYTEDVSPENKAAYESFARSFDVASKTETISQVRKRPWLFFFVSCSILIFWHCAFSGLNQFLWLLTFDVSLLCSFASCWRMILC